MNLLVQAYIGSKAQRKIWVDYNHPVLRDIKDEDALCFMNPEYSCVTCSNVTCKDWGMRFASCPDHQKKEDVG